MGVDIHGWVEAKLSFDTEHGWRPVIRLVWLYSVRNYDVFGCFFGVKNHAGFRPLAPDRGIPEDVSPEVGLEVERYSQMLASYDEEVFGQSWITWEEMKQIDWDEETLRPDQQIHEYRRNEQGELVYKGKGAFNPVFAERVGYDPSIDDQEQEWDLGDVVYRRVRLKRKEIKEDCDGLYRFLEILAVQFAVEQIRLVVWFSD